MGLRCSLGALQASTGTMQIPETLYSLVDHGILESVVRPLMSGKEAQVYLVVSGGEQRVAKIYKEAQNRTFQKRAEYTEGRKVRNSRDQRAMSRGSRHGRAQNEAAWRSTEVDMIYRLRDAGVRVPTPHHFIDGVLIMELVRDAEGYPAPRIGDLTWEAADALAIFQQLLAEVVRMLCAGVVHGDLSEFNVLMGANGPVVIDFPQAVDASTNQNARKLLIRDVANLHRFAAKFAPEHAALPYAEEMWELYKRNALTPDVRLTGRYRAAQKPSDTAAVMGLIQDAARDERRRRENLGLSLRGAPAVQRERWSAQDAGRGNGQPLQRPTQQGQRARHDGPRGDGRTMQRPQQGSSHDPRRAVPRDARSQQGGGYERGQHAAPRAEGPRATHAAATAERRDERSRHERAFGARTQREGAPRANDARGAQRNDGAQRARELPDAQRGREQPGAQRGREQPGAQRGREQPGAQRGREQSGAQRGRDQSGAQRTSESGQRPPRGREVARVHERPQHDRGGHASQGAHDRNQRERVQAPPRSGDLHTRERAQDMQRSGERAAHGAQRTNDRLPREHAAQSASRHEGRRRDQSNTPSEQARDAEGFGTRKRRDEQM